MSTIEYIDNPTPEEFEKNYVKEGRPVVIRGVTKDWKALAHWHDPEYLKQQLGNREIMVQVQDTEHENNESINEGVATGVPIKEFKQMKADSFVDQITNNYKERGSHYIMDVSLQNYIPELLADIDAPPYLYDFKEGDRGLHYRTIFWGRDNFTLPHVHFNNHTLVSQIVGKKTWKLFSPDQSGYMYAPPLWSRSGNPFHCPVDIDNPDLESYPKFKKTKPLVVETQPGDLLYIPTFWWHAVYSPGINIAVGFIYPNDSKWYFRFPRIGMRCFAASVFKGIANKLQWRKDQRG